MDYKINIAQLTWQVFGGVTPGYLPSLSPEGEGTQPSYIGVKTLENSDLLKTDRNLLEVDQEMAKTLLNQPLLDMITFEHTGDGPTYSFTLKDAPIITVTRPRNIVKTAIQGRKGGGTIKEFVSNDDYHITVNGLLANNQDRMPWDLMQDLNEMLIADRTYKVYSKFLTLLGITQIVVDQIGEIKPVDGFTNLIQYSFTLLSDDAPELSV